MDNSNLGFGGRFKLNQAYSPTLANANYTPGMVQLMPTGAPLSMQQPSQMDVGQAQAQAPGSLLGMGNNMQQFSGAQQPSPTQGQMQQLAQMGGGLLDQATAQPEQPQVPQAPQHQVSGRNDALARLLQQYGISGGFLGA